MFSDPAKIPVIAARIRDVARVWSILVFILALILIAGTPKSLPANDWAMAPSDLLIPLSLLISLAGLGIAWRWESWGVLVNLIFYLAVGPLTWLLSGERIRLSIMVGLSPLILPGILFGAAWLLERRARQL